MWINTTHLELSAAAHRSQDPLLKYQLPEIYHSLLPSEILGFRIEEKLATCDNCAMETYRKDLKCCTFEPYLPNYLIGALLTKEKPGSPAIQVIENKIEKRRYSLPVGMLAPIRYQVAFNHRNETDFGNREDWLCPYYNRETNNCNVWRNRGAVCTTFFCKSSYGKKGMGFWAELNDYLTYVEMALMEDALVHLDFSPRQISDCLAYFNRFDGTKKELSKDSMDLVTAKKLWNGYFDEQKEFFVKTYLLVKDLDRKHFAEALGFQGEQLTEKLYKKMKLVEKSK